MVILSKEISVSSLDFKDYFNFFFCRQNSNIRSNVFRLCICSRQGALLKGLDWDNNSEVLKAYYLSKNENNLSFPYNLTIVAAEKRFQGFLITFSIQIAGFQILLIFLIKADLLLNKTANIPIDCKRS